MLLENSIIKDEFEAFISNKLFPCVAARTALQHSQIKIFITDHIACPKDDYSILQFLYNFIDDYRKAETLFHSAAVIFKGPELIDEILFDRFLWQRLQALADLDAKNYSFDKRVDTSPDSENFSFSIKEEALFIIGLHPGSSREARKFAHPTLVFNPHQQFEELRIGERYRKMKDIVRKRDIAYSGSINPNLTDFGEVSEVNQYSGLKHDDSWVCPLNIKHH